MVYERLILPSSLQEYSYFIAFYFKKTVGEDYIFRFRLEFHKKTELIRKETESEENTVFAKFGSSL